MSHAAGSAGMTSWIDTPQERQRLAATLNGRYRKKRGEQAASDAVAAQEKTDKVWRDACEQGRSSSSVRVSWLELRRVSDRVYSYRSTYGRGLRELVLDGISLSTSEHIFEYCTDLKTLSLASNHIADIQGIHALSKLSRLNLLRNNLTILPPSIGKLVTLTRLDLANNNLVELPDEIGQLCSLTHLNLESNELSELPVSFGNLACQVVILNSNNFTIFPDCIGDLKRLRELSIMSNQLTELYSMLGKGRFQCLEVFHASKNRLRILPDSIVSISNLRCLWFAFNNLSSLPPNFHRLQRLKVLKLEGNVDMIYPPLETVALGAEEVLRWSMGRLDTTKLARVRHIVQNLEEVLSLVHRQRIGGDLHDSLFCVNGECYQFPPDALWKVFIPELKKLWSDPQNSCNDGIKSFPFERSEVEQALFEFRDAAGAIVKRLSNARFRRCSCMQTGSREQVCIPPKVGWMCTRPAVIVRMNVAYEENMREKRRLLDEEKRIEDAVKAEEAVAKSFVESEEGMIMVHDEAEKRLALRKEQSKVLVKTSSVASINEKVASSVHNLRSQLSRKERKELREIEEKIKDEYIDQEIAEKKQQVMDANERVRYIMKQWLGVTTDDVFRVWRKLIEKSKKQERRQRRKYLAAERLRYEDALATYENQKIELAKWSQQWDGYNDVMVWVNSDTKETRWEKPSPPLFPLMPDSLKEANADESDLSSSSDDEFFYTDDTDSGTSMSHAESNDEDGDARVDSWEDEPPRGRDAEYDLACKRVLERRIQLIQSGLGG